MDPVCRSSIEDTRNLHNFTIFTSLKFCARVFFISAYLFKTVCFQLWTAGIVLCRCRKCIGSEDSWLPVWKLAKGGLKFTKLSFPCLPVTYLNLWHLTWNPDKGRLKIENKSCQKSRVQLLPNQFQLTGFDFSLEDTLKAKHWKVLISLHRVFRKYYVFFLILLYISWSSFKEKLKSLILGRIKLAVWFGYSRENDSHIFNTRECIRLSSSIP